MSLSSIINQDPADRPPLHSTPRAPIFSLRSSLASLVTRRLPIPSHTLPSAIDPATCHLLHIICYLLPATRYTLLAFAAALYPLRAKRTGDTLTALCNAPAMP